MMTPRTALKIAVLSALLATWLGGAARAEIVTRTIEYEHEGKQLAGYLAYDDAIQGKRPGILVIHEWWGLNDYARMRARKLAELGFVAFAADMYGKGVVATEREHASELAGEFYGKPLMRTRARAGLDVLLRQEQVDRERVAAIGYCFGGTTVLELAYSGAPLRGVVSFHGGLSAPAAEDDKLIRAAILVLHGAEDPYVPAERISAFMKGMQRAGVDWQMIYYGGTVHSFTVPTADSPPGAKYSPSADRRSWEHMKIFLNELFGTN